MLDFSNALDLDVLEVSRLVLAASVAVVQDAVLDLAWTPGSSVDFGNTDLVFAPPRAAGAVCLEAGTVLATRALALGTHLSMNTADLLDVVLSTALAVESHVLGQAQLAWDCFGVALPSITGNREDRLIRAPAI